MGFSDVIKKSFLENVGSANISTTSIVLTIAVTAIIGIYIYVVYRMVCRKSFYSKSFNVSMVALAMITAAIILTIQSSVVISLGMVGALSIVRFRTAVKDPMDLVFLFWSISVGIICGAGLFEVAIIASILVTVAILGLNLVPSFKTPMLLVISADSDEVEEAVKEILVKYTRHYIVKSRNLTQNGMDMIIELKLKDDDA
ncbi:MAG: DUF4956 domain-containing protein, partial [Lachnospiraceae bacterium]|nr:DUF4956 domain-containing protein [Lachnospiraceae bacterium]